jgi:hypothetical protein
MNVTMLPRREKISSPAHDAIVDGDDLRITGSDEEDEENFSVVANASCHTRSFMVGIPDKTKLTKNHAVDDNIQDSEKGGMQLSKRSLKVRKMLRQLRQSRRLLLKFRQKLFLFRSSTNTVAEYEEISENEFGLEEEENYALDSETIVSLRSSRNNVRTGKSMLVRQNVQVLSQPSTSDSNWEISQSHVSDPKGYRNLMLRGKSLILDDCSIGGMSDITEDASSFHGFPKMDHLSFRRTPMFVNANTYCINEDEDEDESDSEEIDSRSSDGTIERAYDFRKLSPLNDGVESTAEETSSLQSPVANDHQVTRLNVYDLMRRRVYSDSDVDSEAHRDVLNTNSQVSNLSHLSLNSNLKNQKQLQNSDGMSSSSSYHDNKSIGKSFREWTPQSRGSNTSSHVATYASWPFPRTRTYSDSYIDQTPINNELQGHPIDNRSNDMEIQNCSPLDTNIGSSTNHHSKVHNGLFLDAPLRTQSSRRQSLPMFERHGQNNSKTLRSRTYSDSRVHETSVKEDILWDPRNTSLLDAETIMASSTRYPEGAFRIFEFDQSPIASEANRRGPQVHHDEQPSPSTKTIDKGIIHPRPATSSVLSTLSHTKNHVADMFVSAKNRKSSPQPSVRNNPSPRTINAASMIAAALRPAPAKRLPTLPTQSPSAAAAQQSDQYYWGSRDVECSNNNSDKNGRDEDRGMELKNLCSWSSESFDDIF